MRRRLALALGAACTLLLAAGAAAWAIGQPGCAAGCFLGATGAAAAGWTFASRRRAGADARTTGTPAGPASGPPGLSEQQIADQVIAAEQDERRRLALLLHDGPLQTLSGIALIHDATLASLARGAVDEAIPLLEKSLARERQIIQTMRDLMVAMEPLVLRDHGFEAAVKALAATIERDGDVRVLLDVAEGDALPEKAQVALYQVLREALGQARKRRPATITVDVEAHDGGDVLVSVGDDGVEERRSASLETLRDRVRSLKARVELETGPGGTSVRILVPEHVAGGRPAPRAATTV